MKPSLTPFELLGALLLIEKEFGRNRATSLANGPRTLDLDILLYGDFVVGGSSLVIPHPRLAERAFVLVPLNEIAPQAIDPRTGSTVSQLLKSLFPTTGNRNRCSFLHPKRSLASCCWSQRCWSRPALAAKLPAPASPTTTVTVTAYRTPLGALESPVTTRLLSQRALSSTPAITLDGQIRQIPGLELFRRSSSLVANPTSQGVSLRGLGSTSASRTLVTDDDVPLNDPIGGWIHWQEQPELAIQSIELVRGGASDLYGSSAIGGVINVIPVRPTSRLAELRSSYGGEGTYDTACSSKPTAVPGECSLAGGLLGTDGFIQEAPSQRGPIDAASNVHSQNALLLAEHNRSSLRLFARANGFNEFRHNGTPYQINATRLVRYATGADWQAPHSASLVARLYGSSERYRQTFSSTHNLPNAANPACSYRCGETPTRFAYIPVNELGATPTGISLSALACFSSPEPTRTTSASGIANRPTAQPPPSPTSTTTSATLLLMSKPSGSTTPGPSPPRPAWTGSRTTTVTNSSGPAQPGPHRHPADPARRAHLRSPPRPLAQTLPALGSLGIRLPRLPRPTPSELYRSTQVGNKLTNPNGNLLSERATGWETGIATQWNWGTIRSSYFLTQVNRPIAAVTTCATCSPILLVRENLGQIESRGLALDFELAPRSRSRPPTTEHRRRLSIRPRHRQPRRARPRQLDSRSRPQHGHPQPARLPSASSAHSASKAA